LKNKVLFRCDGANIPEIGTGHIFRCLTIAKYLKKRFGLRKEDIVFLTRSSSKYNIGFDILKKNEFRVVAIKSKKLKLNSNDELKYLNKNPSDLLIIDRLGKTKKNFVKKLDNSFNKKIIIDDSSANRKYFDISLNPLIHNVKKVKNSFIGFDYLILPVYFYKYKRNTSKNRNIFIFFGGHDPKKLTMKITKMLNKNNLDLTLFVSSIFKKLINKVIIDKKIIFYEQDKYIEKLSLCKIAITAGGMGLFDNIVMKKKIICIPQYKHQEVNAKRIASQDAINLLNLSDKNFEKKFNEKFIKLYKNVSLNKRIILKQNKISNMKKLHKTLTLIGKTYVQSKN
jgi:UDP-2,4-diacetamido-2,4,6-trideoxy-beta-L-altropyranose hydrolase|tara:strand:- start:230 stop:1249 length:1020 start_codon:yes stop_codon:yes gene_type:complete